jgi:hypothetical protein
MWEPDRRVYALLLFVWALLLVASLATVSPEEPEPMYLIRHSELLSLRAISKRLREDSGMLKNEAASWKQNSEALELELENSSVELSMLKTELETLIVELETQRPRLTELGSLLISSEKLVEELKRLVAELEARANFLIQSLEQSNRALSQVTRSRNFWRILAFVFLGVGGAGWTMILYWP